MVPVPSGGNNLEQLLCDHGQLQPDTTLNLAAGVHLISKDCVVTSKGLTIVGASNLTHKPSDDLPMNASVISGAYTVPREAWGRADTTSAVWMANIPEGTWSAGQEPPQQLWLDHGGPQRARRTRARHPNLIKPNGIDVYETPYLFWQAELCDIHSQQMAHCELHAPGCHALHCNTSYCEQCTQMDKYGFRYNATVDGALFQKLADSLPQNGTGRLQVVVYHGWTASRHYVSAIHTPGHAVEFSNPSNFPIGFWSGLQSEGGQRYYVENDEAFLDSPGEWFIRETGNGGGKLLYMPFPDENMSALDARLPIVSNMITLLDTHDFTMRSLAIAHSDWTCGGPGRNETCDDQSAEFQDGAALRLINSTNVNFDGVHLLRHGQQGLWVDGGCSNITFQDGSIYDLGTGGVRVGTLHGVGKTSFTSNSSITGVTVHNNYISNGGWVFPAGTAVLIESAVLNATITHNEISEFSYTAISLGWSWSYVPQPHTGGHLVAKNHIHHIGFPRREVGDAMACIYTLGQLNETVVNGNLCHDVRAYMSGGYCLSQDQGSSNIKFTNNVCLRVTGTPHNTHYGVNITYENNIFWGGYWNSWVSDPRLGAGALRTSPSKTTCGSIDFPDACPDQLQFSRNLIGQWANSSARLFDGNFEESTSPSPGAYHFGFSHNFYWSDLLDANLTTASVFGGESPREGPNAKQYTWTEWRMLHDNQQDVGSVIGKSHPFANNDWATTYNVTISAASTASTIGWQHIDTSDVGPEL